MTISTTFKRSYGYNPKYRSDLLDGIVADPDRVISDDAKILKHDRTTTVALIDKAAYRWIIKRYNTKNTWHALRRLLRRSRAYNCWEMSKLFEHAGISIPTPVAYIEKRFGPLRGRSYFINEYVNAENLFTYVTTRQNTRNGTSIEVKVVELFEALRTAGINHGDMKATNILVLNGKLLILDLDAARKVNGGALFQRGYEKDRFRFLKNWTNHPDIYSRFDAALPVL